MYIFLGIKEENAYCIADLDMSRSAAGILCTTSLVPLFDRGIRALIIRVIEYNLYDIASYTSEDAFSKNKRVPSAKNNAIKGDTTVVFPAPIII